MDELDEQIMSIIRKKGRSRIDDIVNEISVDYHINYLRCKIRRHADSLTRYGFLKKSVVKKYSTRSSVYAYEVKDDE